MPNTAKKSKSLPKNATRPKDISHATIADVERWRKAIDGYGYEKAIARMKRFAGVSPIGAGLLSRNLLSPAETVKLFRRLPTDGTRDQWHRASDVETTRLLVCCDWLVHHVVPLAIDEFLPPWGNRGKGPAALSERLRACTKTLWTQQIVQALNETFNVHAAIYDEARIGTNEENRDHRLVTLLTERAAQLLGHATQVCLGNNKGHDDSWTHFRWMGSRILGLVDPYWEKGWDGLRDLAKPSFPKLLATIIAVHGGDSRHYAAELCDWSPTAFKKKGKNAA